MTKTNGKIIRNSADTISIAEAARRLGCAPATVYEGMNRKVIPFIQIGQSRKVIPRELFERYLKYGHAAMTVPLDIDLDDLADRIACRLLRAQAEQAQNQLAQMGLKR